MSELLDEDTQVGTGDADTSDAAQESAASEETPQMVFGKYKSLDDAQKGFKELERRLHEVTTENSTLRKDTDLKEVLAKMTDIAANKDKGSDGDAVQTMLEEIGETFREDPKLGVAKLADTLNAWIADEGKKVKGATDKELNALRAEVSAMREGMSNMNPEYQENRETVDQLVEDGMPKAKAIEWAKKMRGSSRVLPVSVNGQRRPAASTGVYLTKEDREVLKRTEGLSDADLDTMEAEHQERTKRLGQIYQQKRQ